MSKKPARKPRLETPCPSRSGIPRKSRPGSTGIQTSRGKIKHYNYKETI